MKRTKYNVWKKNTNEKTAFTQITSKRTHRIASPNPNKPRHLNIEYFDIHVSCRPRCRRPRRRRRTSHRLIGYTRKINISTVEKQAAGLSKQRSNRCRSPNRPNKSQIERQSVNQTYKFRWRIHLSGSEAGAKEKQNKNVVNISNDESCVHCLILIPTWLHSIWDVCFRRTASHRSLNVVLVRFGHIRECAQSNQL